MKLKSKRSSLLENFVLGAITVVGGSLIALITLTLIFGLVAGMSGLLIWIGNLALHYGFGIAMLGWKKTLAAGLALGVLRMLFTSGAKS